MTWIAFSFAYFISVMVLVSSVYGIAMITAFRNLLLVHGIDSATASISAEGIITTFLMLYGIFFWFKNREHILENTSYLAFSFLLALFTANVIFHDIALQPAAKVLRLAGYFSLYLIVAELSRSETNRRILETALILSIFVTVVPTVYILICNDAVITNQSKPLNGIMSKNNFGFYSCYMTLFSVYYFNSSKNFLKKCFALIMTTLCSVALALSYTRAAWIAFLVAFVVHLLISRNHLKSIIVLVLVLLVGSLLSAVLYRGMVLDLHQKREVGMNSYEFRYNYAWPASIRAFKERPYFGHGLGHNLKAMQTVGRLNNTSHSDYLVILVETGILGLSAYVIFVSSLFTRTVKSIYKARNSDNKMLAVMSLSVFIAFLVGGIAEHLIQTPGATGYMITILAMGHGIAKKDCCDNSRPTPAIEALV